MKRHQLAAGIALWLATGLAGAQPLIETNHQVFFTFTGSLDRPFEHQVALDEAAARQRLFNSRLGTRGSGTVQVVANLGATLRVHDPGVSVPPDAARELMQVRLNGEVSAPWWSAPVPMFSGRALSCPAGLLRCVDNPLSWTDRSDGKLTFEPSAPPALGPVQVRVTPTVSASFPGASVIAGEAQVGVHALMTAVYQSKSLAGYVGDGLAATAGAPRSAAARYQDAAADVAALRTVRADAPIGAAGVAVHQLPALQQAQTLLELARDGAQLHDPGQHAFASQSALLRDSWNLLRQAEGLGGREVAQRASGIGLPDPMLELATMLAAAAPSDAAFMAEWQRQHAQLQPPSFRDGLLPPMLSLDLARFGAGAGQLLVYAVNPADAGQVTIHLPGAERYAMVQRFSSLALAFGPAAIEIDHPFGVLPLEPGGEALYLGDDFGSVFSWRGVGGPLALGFEAGAQQLYLVAAFGVQAVPEPESVALWVGGLLALGAWSRRRRAAALLRA